MVTEATADITLQQENSALFWTKPNNILTAKIDVELQGFRQWK